MMLDTFQLNDYGWIELRNNHLLISTFNYLNDKPQQQHTTNIKNQALSVEEL